MDTRTAFGEWLRQRRKLLDLTQQELADQVGCSSVTVRKLEAGERKPSQQLAANLAMSLQVPDREREAFIRFARANQETSFSLPAWEPERPSWRADQLPGKRPQPVAQPHSWHLHYDLVALEQPTYTDADDGRLLFEARSEGHVEGDFSGAIKFHYTQVVDPKPDGIDISQALPMRVAASFTVLRGDDRMEGICTGMIYPAVDAKGNGSARFQGSGQIISVTVGMIDFFLCRVFIEDEVKMVEGTGTGARGTLRLESPPQ